MIQAFQRFSKSFVAKAFLVIVALSFGVFFGGTQYFGGKNSIVAEVGDMTISYQELRFALEQERRALEVQSNQNISLEMMAHAGFINMTLQRLIARALLDQEANNMRLAVSDMQILDTIHKQKMFQNEQGEFDRTLFDRILFSNRMTEDMYVADIKSELMRQQLTGAVLEGAFAPKVLSDSVLDSLLQIRQGATVVVETQNMSKPPFPGDEVLQSFYTEQKDLFMQPELRSFTALILKPDLVAGDFEITDGDLESEYDATKEDYGDKKFADVKDQIRKNLVKQFAADKLYELSQQVDDEIAGGASFEEIAKSYNLEPIIVEDVTVTALDRDGDQKGDFVNDKSVQEQILSEVFALEENLESPFTETTEGEYFIVRVDRVQQAQPLAYQDIKDRVYKEWVYTQQVMEAYKNAEKIVDGINNGSHIPGTLNLLPNVSLSIPQKDVSENIVSALYSLFPGQAVAVPSDEGFVVVMLKNIIHPTKQAASTEREKAEIETVQLLKEDTIQSYVSALRIRYPVKINWELLQAIMQSESE